MQLRIPGPTPCPSEVLKASSRQMINHRGREFGVITNRITEKLKTLFQTKNDVLILTGSGTGSMEAAIVNTLSPGDKVIACSIGEFGERFSAIAEAFGANVVKLSFDYGLPVDPDALRKVLKENPDAKAVLVTHNETSTGITNDLPTLSAIVKESDKLFIVDAISSLGCIDLKVDDWKCDVVITGSQKGWMVPPGLAMVSVSEKAWQANAKARMPRFYWDFAKAKKFLEKGQTPWTPAVSIFFALDVSLEMLMKEGLDKIFARHARVAKYTKEGIKGLGLSLFAEGKYASNTITAVKGDGYDVTKLLNTLEDEYEVVLTGGQGKLAGKIFRIGHLGWVLETDIDEVISTLKKVLPKVKL
jgi:aspartate aminotransferase-like enzyme